jgi:phage shock protein PspC (stress-responsive transcriptional regulator)
MAACPLHPDMKVTLVQFTVVLTVLGGLVLLFAAIIAATFVFPEALVINEHFTK